MALFWSLSAVCIVACVGTLVWPLLRRARPHAAPDAETATVAIYRDQKRQLARDRDSGAISGVDFDRGLAELERRVAEDVGFDAPAASAASPLRREWPAALVLLVLVPTAAVMLYVRLGNPAAVGGDDAPQVSEKEIEAMVDSLAQKLKGNPDDGQGWLLLARSYQAVERFPQAAEAYARAEALAGANADMLADYADVLAMAQGRRLDGKPSELVQRALALDPVHKKSLALAATAALERRDLDAALRYWRVLQSQFTTGSEDYREIAAIIAEIESARAKENTGSPPVVARQDPLGPPAAGPLSSPPAAPRGPPVAQAGTAGASISGHVELAASLAARVAESDVAFIYARAVEGSRMPLAIRRLPAKNLPTDFALDDSMGMAPGTKLSDAAQVIVEARISKSGNAMPQAGDLVGRSGPVKAGEKNIRITIDQVVP